MPEITTAKVLTSMINESQALKWMQKYQGAKELPSQFQLCKAANHIPKQTPNREIQITIFTRDSGPCILKKPIVNRKVRTF